MDVLLQFARPVVIYLFIVLCMRLFGKKELSQLSITDLVFILLISNAVQNAMLGDDTTLLGGIIAAGSLFLVNSLLEFFVFKSKTISRLVEGSETLLIYHGKIIQKHLNAVRMTREELEAAVREHGVENIQDVDLAVLEIDGNISILSQDFQKKTTRKRKTHKVLTENQ